MAQRLFDGNIGLELLANSIATGAALLAIILAFGAVSGAHLNPVVSLCDAAVGGLPWRRVPGYCIAQFLGALAGTALANGMFGLSLFTASHHGRHGPAQLLSEFLATFGLLAVIWGCVRARANATAFAVAAYIVGAYWFTVSTSFANPAVTLARSLTDSFAGIAPADVLPFALMQLLGGAAATALFAWLLPTVQKA